MRKLSLFALLLAGGFLFSGCVIMDHPSPQISDPSVMGCTAGCGGYDNGHGWLDGTNGTAGPTGYLLPLEEGEHFYSAADLGTLQAGPVEQCPWDTIGGGAAKVSIDTYINQAGDEASGCPPYTYLCGWGFWPLASAYCLCEAQPLNTQQTLCNLGNGQCNGPIGSFASLTGATWYNWPANSFQNYMNWRCVDATPGPPAEFQENVRRRPGQLCVDCGVTASIQAPEGKVVICHVPPGNPDNAHTIIVGAPAVPAHLAHGDYEGECGGGGPIGEGLQIPSGNIGPDWTLGIGYYIDVARYLLLGQQPWTMDWTSCARALCGNSDAAIAKIADILAASPADDKGLVTLSMRKLNGLGESVVLDPPLDLKVKMQVNDGKPAFVFAINPSQPGFRSFVQWAINSTPDKGKMDLSPISIEMTSGRTLQGSVLQAALPYKLSVNHDRLIKFLDDYDSMQAQSRNLDARVAGR